MVGIDRMGLHCSDISFLGDSHGLAGSISDVQDVEELEQWTLQLQCTTCEFGPLLATGCLSFEASSRGEHEGYGNQLRTVCGGGGESMREGRLRSRRGS